MITNDESRRLLPRRPIDAVTEPVERFLHVEAASGVALLLCTTAAFVLANSPWREQYLAFWETGVTLGFGSSQMTHSLRHWINDGLMTLFFFLIGLEIKREIVIGELRDARSAVLPIVAALGGMVAPAALYLALQPGGAAQRGWGIPMATDIAFVVGCLALLSTRVPGSLRVLLLSLAIADDVGAILVIAIGYSSEIHAVPLGLGLSGLALVFMASRLGVRSLLAYSAAGWLIWLAFHASGVHATLAGVALGLLTPMQNLVNEGGLQRLFQRVSGRLYGDRPDALNHRAGTVSELRFAAREAVSPVEFLQHAIHPWVSFGIMPVFALANAGVELHGSDFAHPVSVAVAVGLVVGKPVGIALACWLAVVTGIARLPAGVTWPILIAGGCLAGIGFTMSLFIAGIALSGRELAMAQVGVLMASAISATVGMALLWKLLPAKPG